MIRIKFKTDADEARGFYELLTRASGEGLQGGVYWIEESALKILDESGIGDEILTTGESKAHEAPAQSYKELFKSVSSGRD
jgi:hypothetical protein